MNAYRIAARVPPYPPPPTLKKGDHVCILDDGIPSKTEGTVVMATDKLVGVNMDGGGYFQASPDRFRKKEKWWDYR